MVRRFVGELEELISNHGFIDVAFRTRIQHSPVLIPKMGPARS